MTTETKTEWIIIPFSYLGINLQSRFLRGSDCHTIITRAGEGYFITLNQMGLKEMTQIKADSKLSFIQQELDKVNYKGTHSFIELGKDN